MPKRLIGSNFLFALWAYGLIYADVDLLTKNTQSASSFKNEMIKNISFFAFQSGQ